MSYATQADLEARFGATSILGAALAEFRFDGAWSGRKGYAPDDVTTHGGGYWKALEDIDATAAPGSLNDAPSDGNDAWANVTADVGAVIDAALADAAAEIDDALGAAFEMPLGDGPWPGLRAIQCDIARLHLHDDSVPETVADRASDARSRLGLIVMGKRKLLDVNGKPRTRRATVRTAGPKPMLTRQKLEAY